MGDVKFTHLVEINLLGFFTLVHAPFKLIPETIVIIFILQMRKLRHKDTDNLPKVIRAVMAPEQTLLAATLERSTWGWKPG